MAKNNLIKVFCFGVEVGTLGLDLHKSESYFQYNPDFLKNEKFLNLIPNTGIIKKTSQVQIFKQYNNETFRGIPPVFADSLPDMFGNIIFKTWLESENKDFKTITVLEQLAYVSNRGMGALEYRPEKKLSESSEINIDKIVEVLKKVLDLKEQTNQEQFNHDSLLNVFKIGTSAGGARPKILISENKKTGKIIPGDINISEEYTHYLVKLDLDEVGYRREVIEFCYYLAAKECKINISQSKLIEEKHFATERFDRIDGKKIHTLTATGITGWDFKNPDVSSYENLFELCVFLKIPHSEIEQLFRRMVFNILYCNTDDHLKNHSFCYDENSDSWNLAPAYDITYSLNPLINYKKSARALAVNGKRTDINLTDIDKIAEKFTIKNSKKIISEVQNVQGFLKEKMSENGISDKIIDSVSKDFVLFQ